MNTTDPRELELGPLSDGVVTLRVLERHGLAGPIHPGYVFAIDHVDGRELGRLLLRVDDTPGVRTQAGHLAYEIAPEHRGHRYAARACRLALTLAAEHLDAAWILTAPDNLASRRTAELAGAEYVDTQDLPPDSDVRQAIGATSVARYRVNLDRA
jgi:tagatose 1,6-diphosphate aldolase